MRNTAVGACLIALLAVAWSARAQDIPVQNQVRGEPPSVASAETGAALLLAAIAQQDAASAHDFFFPAAPFLALKDARDPGRYHRLLLRYFDEDIAALRRDLGPKPCRLEKLTLGPCRWIEAGAQANKLPYWSCRRTLVSARCGERLKKVELHTLINWEDTWYVTHLASPR